MKLEPRERRLRSDYILDNAAALQLGKLYLGWGRSKRRSKPKRATPAAVPKPKAAPVKASTKKTSKTAAAKSSPVSEKAARTAPRTPTKQVPTKPATRAPPVEKRPRGRPRKTTSPAAAIKSVPPKTRSRGRPATAPAKAPPKAATRDSVRPCKNPNPVVKSISSKVVAAATAAAAAVSASAKVPATPLPHTPRKTAKVLATKTVVQQHRRRANNKVPPVIPNPVPTPALLLGAAEQWVDRGDVTVLVRTMNGTSFRLACTSESTLWDLKRRILEVIMPWTASASPGSMVRLPMLVMNGRALGPETATLAALRFSADPETVKGVRVERRLERLLPPPAKGSIRTAAGCRKCEHGAQAPWGTAGTVYHTQAQHPAHAAQPVCIPTGRADEAQTPEAWREHRRALQTPTRRVAAPDHGIARLAAALGAGARHAGRASEGPAPRLARLLLELVRPQDAAGDPAWIEACAPAEARLARASILRQGGAP
ncbi:hypothetical protein CGC21_6815 [Leishmania donovani]|uniref:Ubiquitin-like domain-containing protein n=1 Tax=Leishmania donovani TaxID=5661 RepID=A0A504XEC8_LEIDO|nr:hypothetical protein CGC21_6815 [Leishmania donovani]